MYRLLILALACGLVNCVEFSESHHGDYSDGPQYTYSYALHDPKTGNIHIQKEERQGGSSQGEYSVVEADGTKRLVHYTVQGKEEYSANVVDEGGPSYKSSEGGPSYKSSEDGPSYKSSQDLQSYYKSGSSYEGSSGQQTAGFLASLSTYKSYKPSLPDYQPSYKGPLPSYKAPLPSYKAPIPSYNKPTHRSFVPIFEPGYKPVLFSAVFKPARVTYQPNERAGYRPFPSSQPPVPSHQSVNPSYQPEFSNFQPALPIFKPSPPSYNPAISNFEPTYPSFKGAVPSYEPNYKAPSPSYQSTYEEGTATSSVSFSTKGAHVITSTKHISPPKIHY